MTTLRDAAFRALASPPFPCPNCDAPIGQPRLFCSDLCKDEAKFVRYYRACIADGRVQDPLVFEALQIRMAFILGGGYPEQERQLPSGVRAALIDDAKEMCQSCGEPANQVDHISGSSSALDNLQLLCTRCHNKKTIASFAAITPESHPEETAKLEALLARVNSIQPARFCDRAEWASEHRGLQRARKAAAAG